MVTETEILSVVNRIKTDQDIIESYDKGERDFIGLIIIPSPNSTFPDFEGLNLNGIRLKECTILNSNFKNADLSNSDLSGSDLSDSSFEGTNLTNTNLSKANLFNSNLKGSIINNTNLSNANLSDADLTGVDLAKANTMGAIFESEKERMTYTEIIEQYRKGRRNFSSVIATNSDFGYMDLSGIIFKKANLHYSNFSGTNLTNADLSNCDLTDCNFKNAILKNTNFSGSNFFWSTFEGAYIENAKFMNANISWCNLTKVDFSSADLTGADLSWSLMMEVNLSKEQVFNIPQDMLATVKLDEETKTDKIITYGRLTGGIYGGKRTEGVYGAIQRTGSEYGSIIHGEAFYKTGSKGMYKDKKEYKV